MSNTHPDPLAHLRVLTMKDICRLTSYTPQHVYRLERAGRFPRRIRMGSNRIAYRLRDYEAWLAQREQVRPANDNPPDKT